MKINIIGPSGSGKTYLAKRLSEKYQIPFTDLDTIMFTHLPNKKRYPIPKEEYLKELNKIFLKKDWIIEGLPPIAEVFDQAEKIIWLKPRCCVSLFQQWKRFATDKFQRERYGFINNIKLSIYILKQYCGMPTPNNDPKKTWVRSLEKELENYKEKVIILKNRKEKQEFIRDLYGFPPSRE